jgi:hypothetical protein
MLNDIRQRAEDLRQKGLLKRQIYAESSAADLRKRYLNGDAQPISRAELKKLR